MTAAQHIFGADIQDLWPAHRRDHHPDGATGQGTLFATCPDCDDTRWLALEDPILDATIDVACPTCRPR